jgi:excisionase family DNA binding protein
MSEQPGTFQRVTVAEAAGILGVSTTTVRRMVKRGQLEGQQVLRPQGTAFVVLLPAEPEHAAEDAAPTRRPSGGMARGNAAPSEQLTAWSATFLLPLVATIERQADQLVSQAETIGTLRAERDILRAAHRPGASNLELPARLVTVTPWLVLLGILALAGVVGWLR